MLQMNAAIFIEYETESTMDYRREKIIDEIFC